jgi:hypothetical protein
MRELEVKCEGLEKIRKDIMCTVSQGELPLAMEEMATVIKKDRNLPYSGHTN